MKIALIVLASAALVVGCQVPVDNSKKELEELRTRIDDLDAQLKTIRDQVFDANMALIRHGTRITGIQNQYRTIVLDPGGPEQFQRLDTSVGTFLVSIESIAQRADGVEVVLNVGNTTSARISGGIFTASWGSRAPPEDDDGWVDWALNLNRGEIKFTKSLEAGTWNKIPLSLKKQPIDSFGYLELSLETPSVIMLVQSGG